MTITKKPGKFVETEIDDEVVLMDLESGNFFSLAGTSLAVWKAIDGACTEAQIVSRLAGDYAADADLVAADVAEFLAELRNAGLIEG